MIGFLRVSRTSAPQPSVTRKSAPAVPYGLARPRYPVTNTYAAPVFAFMPGAPATTVVLDRATELPKLSFAAPSAAVSLACWDQVVPDRTNTNAAPVNEFSPGEPATAVVPDTATELPKLPTAPVSLACRDQMVPDRTNTNAAPAAGAPATTVVPDRATEVPRNCWKPWAKAVSLACWDQVVPDRTNTNAAPVNELLRGSPTTAVDPDTATDQPRSSDTRLWTGAVSLACRNQVVPDRTNTYAAPVIRFPKLWKGAPTTAVDPDRA